MATLGGTLVQRRIHASRIFIVPDRNSFPNGGSQTSRGGIRYFRSGERRPHEDRADALPQRLRAFRPSGMLEHDPEKLQTFPTRSCVETKRYASESIRSERILL